jgi:hypothetical protein
MVCMSLQPVLCPFAYDAQVDASATQFSATCAGQAFVPYTFRGKAAGQYRNAGTFSFIRVYGAGHEVPAYTIGSPGVGEAALQMLLITWGRG